jgi:hypothetical protein
MVFQSHDDHTPPSLDPFSNILCGGLILCLDDIDNPFLCMNDVLMKINMSVLICMLGIFSALGVHSSIS